jgi:hypothetical protein
MNDLEVMPTADLIDELCRRCVPAIFIGTKIDGEGKDVGFKTFFNYRGNLDTCRGLCHELDCILEREMIRQEIGDDE